MNKEQEKAWVGEEKAALAARKNLLSTTYSDIVALLQKARSDIALLLSGQPSDYQTWHLSALNSEIDRILSLFGDSAGNVIGKSVVSAWLGGVAQIDKPMAAIGFQMMLPVLDVTPLRAMSTFTVDRIKDVGIQAASKIKTEIGLALIGAQDIATTIKKVGSIMGEESRSRVTTIVGDNLSTAWASAGYARAVQTTDAGVPLKKIWRRSGKIHSRLAHDLADGTVKPIDQPFVINGHSLLFARDPAAPLAEKINCGCITLYRPADIAGTLPDKRPFTAREIELNPLKAQTANGKTLAEVLQEMK